MSTPRCDLLVEGASLVATVDDAGHELAGGWVAITGNRISGTGDAASPPPPCRERIDAAGCLVTPGLINTHHHMFQNLTRAWSALGASTLLGWAQAAMGRWSLVDERSIRLSAWVAAAELALSGCTTSSDMMYAHVRSDPDLFDATVDGVAAVGLRFHPVRAAVTVGVDGGGVHASAMVQRPEDVLASCERAIGRHHDPAPGAMVRVALGPSMLISVEERTARALARLADTHDLRIHTHIAEDPEGAADFARRNGCSELDRLEEWGLLGPRTWLAHGVLFDDDDIARVAAAGTGVAHCPASNAIMGAGIAPVSALRAARVPVGLGVDGSASSDASSMIAEARLALLLGKLRNGPESVHARDVLRMATRGGAACLGREGELGQLAVGTIADVVLWPIGETPATAGVGDLVEAWLRCTPMTPREVIVNGRRVVTDGRLTVDDIDFTLAQHRAAADRLQHGN